MSSVSSLGSSTLSSGGSTTTGTSSGTSLSGSLLSFTGLASGIDTNSIIQGLLQIQKNQITNLQNQEVPIKNQQTSFDGIEANIIAFQSQVSSLADSVNGVFDGRTVNSTDSNVATGAASGGTAPGSYTFRVNSLAAAQQLASQGFDSATSTINQGTFSFKTGTGAATTITVDGTNNTLQGLASAINTANAGVSASIVNDGSSNQPYRLLLISNNTGTANAISITDNLTTTSSGSANPLFTGNYIGPAESAASNTSTAAVSANSGAGNYTGTDSTVYNFTVANSGVVGTDNITLNYTYKDANGATQSGTVALGSGDAGVAKTVANGVTVTVGSGNLVAGDTFSVKTYVPTVQAAADASVTLGSGAGALTVTSSSNQVNGVIPGVTVNLVAANPTENVTLTVAANTDNITKAIQGFVDSYNTVVKAANAATSFDSSTNTASPLLGNGSLTDISNQLALGIANVVPGLTQNLNNISSLGITQNNDGTLALDSSRLSQVLAGQVSGVSLNDVKKLFTLGGTTNNTGVQFTFATDKTQASGNTPYQVNITQAATQGAVTGLSAINFTSNVPPTVVITNSNNTFTISVNGHTSNLITIPQGSYTSAQLAQVIQSQINADTALGTNDVEVSINSGYLQIGSLAYGSSSSVAIQSGTALSTLGLSAGQVGSGQNVAGSFTVNGKTEAATGTGQELIGNSGNANTDGLQLLVTLTAAQVSASPTTNVTVTRGLASSLNQTLNGLTDPVNGRFLSIDQGFKDQIANIETTITNDNNLIQQQQDQLTAQFAALESQISQLKNVGNTITAQLNANTSNSNGFSQGL